MKGSCDFTAHSGRLEGPVPAVLDSPIVGLQGQGWWSTARAAVPTLCSRPRALALTPTGQAVLTGHYWGEKWRVPLTMMVDATGTIVWSTGEGLDEGTALAVDRAGNVFLAGVLAPDSDVMLRIAKLDPAGRRLWVQPVSTGVGMRISQLLADDHGNAHLVSARYVDDLGVQHTGVHVSTLDPDGRELGSASHFIPDGALHPESSALLPTGELLVGANHFSKETLSHAMLKFSLDGRLLWHEEWRGLAGENPGSDALAVDSSGHVYAAVRVIASDGTVGSTLLARDFNGTLLWTLPLSRAPEETLWNGSLAIGPGNSVIWGGTVWAPRQGSDIWVAALDTTGVERWVRRHDQRGGAADDVRAMALDREGHLFLASEVATAGTESTDRWFDVEIARHAVDVSGLTLTRGDCNQSGRVDIADALFLLGHLFRGSQKPRCLAACDADLDREASLQDAIYLLSFLFHGARPPAPPYPVCGEVLLDDPLDCEEPARC